MEEILENQISNSLDKKISGRFLILFSLSSIIMMIFTSLYTMVDGAFVSKLIGTDALSAINIVLPLITTSIAFATMLATGGNAIIAKKMGQDDNYGARIDFSTVIWTTIITGITFSILCLIFMKPILRFLGADSSIYNYCYNYALISSLFIPASMLAILFQVFLVTAGKGGLGLTFTIIGGISNIVLDYVFIEIFNMGIAGAAIATGIGYSITGLFGLVYFIVNHKNPLYLVKPNFNYNLLKDICINGSSEMVSSLSSSVVTLLLNITLMKLIGVDGVAAITVILYVQMLLSATFMGYSIGVSPLISFNYGKNDTNRLRKIYSLSLIGIMTVSIFICIFGIVKSDMLVAFFVDRESTVYTIAISGMKIFSISFLFMGINIFSSALFTSLSNGKVSAILSFLRTLVFVVISILIFPLIFGVTGVWIAVPIAELLALIFSIYYLIKLRHQYNYY